MIGDIWLRGGRSKALPALSETLWIRSYAQAQSFAAAPKLWIVFEIPRFRALSGALL